MAYIVDQPMVQQYFHQSWLIVSSTVREFQIRDAILYSNHILRCLRCSVSLPVPAQVRIHFKSAYSRHNSGMYTQLPRKIPEPVEATPTKTTLLIITTTMHTRNQKSCCLWLRLIPYGCQTCPYSGTWRFRFYYCIFQKLPTLMERHKPELHDEHLFSESFSNEIMQMIQTGNICNHNNDL